MAVPTSSTRARSTTSACGPREWPLHLRAARAAGLNAVSSYVPWLWHEPREGDVRLHRPHASAARPARATSGWCASTACTSSPASVPSRNAELVNEGVPGWLLSGHPEVSVRGRDITNLPHTTLLAYHHPVFQELRRALVRRRAAGGARGTPTRAGPSILVQLDNEIGMVHWLQKAADHGEGTQRRYREFLRARYGGDLARLNAAHGSAWRDFAEVSQPADGDDRREPRLLRDWMAFYQRYYADYFGSLHARYRAHGLELPVLANIPQFYDFDVRGRGRVRAHDLADVPRLPGGGARGAAGRRLPDAPARLRELPRHRRHHRGGAHARRPGRARRLRRAAERASCATGRGSTRRTSSST